MTADDETQVATSEVVRDEEFWYDDGNIILIANNNIAFRVYRGILARVSPIFHDLFSFPQSEKEETMDGCPVVHLSDSAETLRPFLRVIFQPAPSDSIDPCRKRWTYPPLAAIVRIAHKYQVDSALGPAVKCLAELFDYIWPGGRVSWSTHWDNIRQKLDIELKDAIDAAVLLRLGGASEAALRQAFFLCCLCEPVQLRNGVVRADGTEARLSDEDYTRCVRASIAMSQECHRIVQRTLIVAIEGIDSLKSKCANQDAVPNKCKEVLELMVFQHATDGTTYPISDLLVGLQVRDPVPKVYQTLSEELCKECRGPLLGRSEALVAVTDLSTYFE